MARNWQVAESVDILRDGKHKAALQDIGRRFPLFAQAIARGEDGMIEILRAMPMGPGGMSVRRIERVLQEGITPEGIAALDDEEIGIPGITTEEEEKPAPKKVAKKAATKKEPEEEAAEENDEWDDVEEEKSEDVEEEKSETEIPDDLNKLTVQELRELAKREKISLSGVRNKAQAIEAIEAALNPVEEESEEDSDDDWGDDDWDL